MKKSLFAVAAVTAFAGAAQAQSSVTVYGIVDMGYSNTSTRVNTSKVNSSAFTTNAETDSRLGFKGTEDLGGGTSAFFTIEAQLSGMNGGAPAYGTVTNATPNSANVIGGNRQTFVGLKKKGIGSGAIGTQYTPMHDSVAATDPGGSNNVIGSIIRPIGVAAANGAATTASGNHLVRTTNAIKFNSDKFAGFGLNALYSLNQSNSTQTGAQSTTAPAAGTAPTAIGGSNNYSGYGISADYTWKKLFATVAMNSFSQEQSLVGQSATTAALPGTESLGTQTNVKINDVYAAGTYDFGVLKAFAGYTNRKITGALNSNQYLKRSGQQIGVRSFITPAIEGWASIGNGKYQAFGTNEPTANFNAWQLGTNYYLSKRSNLYAIYGQSLTSSTSAQTQGAAGSQFALGVRHSF
ncbi:porin [Polynucleobacter sp. AM-7D1]|uniref:porin n=1 Tax=Polynucleobacter sp. AM-7D1 TaxID=2689102 RepID=UPI001BFD6340|nr:porin [Polynucleobacter sp. AM-7D1]QWE28837.1 porin [Polynucleobacter sp. AM-7D1]